MRITNLDRSSIYPDLSDRQHVTLPEAEREGLRTGLKAGDILISITADIGIIGYVDERIPFPAYINQHVACLRLPQDQVWPKFVAYYLASAEPQKRFIEMTDVGAKTGINLTTVGKLTFPCPPLPEQQAIAAALSDADGVVAGLERVIAKKRLIKQGAMQDLLTARRRLPGFSGEWEVKRLGSVLKMQVGFPFSSAFFSKRETGPRLVRNRDLRSNDDLVFYSGAYADQFLLYDGDILIGMDGDFSPTKWSGGIALLNQRVGRLKALAEIDLRFCYYVLQDELKKLESVTSGTTVKHLSHYDIEKISVRMPDFDEQKAIAAVLSDMDAEIQTLESRLAKARAVKEGMMQNLLTGRVRLV